ncbi:MAG: hypothetical protein RL419_161 [Actinomycetota bacterium]
MTGIAVQLFGWGIFAILYFTRTVPAFVPRPVVSQYCGVPFIQVHPSVDPSSFSAIVTSMTESEVTTGFVVTPSKLRR